MNDREKGRDYQVADGSKKCKGACTIGYRK